MHKGGRTIGEIYAETHDNNIPDASADSMDWNVKDEYKGMSLPEIKEVQASKSRAFSVCVINTTGSLNIGVLLRSAVLFGAERFYIAGRRRYDKRSTVGAHNYIQVDRLDYFNEDGSIDYERVIARTVADGYSPVMIETGGPNIGLMLNNFSHKPRCLFLGEEKDGIPQEILDKGYPIYTIPMVGVMRSLNVSVAGGIAMFMAMQSDRPVR